MESYRTEEEQVEALKGWWKENGRGILIGVVLALGLGFGWQGWQKSQQLAAENASVLYQQMLQALALEEEQGAEPAKALAARLKDEHRGTTYAQFAALHLARLAVGDKQLSEAETELRWVLAMASAGDDIHQAAQLRLARVLAARGESDEALAMLSGAVTDFAASYALARGDILLELGREDEALVAYEAAASAIEPGSPMPETLEDKIQFLTARIAAAPAEAS